jgi:cytochrome b6-f complex iron-sulfur subunit
MRKKNQQDMAGTPSSRRSVLTMIWLGLGLAALAEVGWLVFSFFRPARPLAGAVDKDKEIDAGSLDNFKPNTVTAFPRGQFYLACLQDGGLLALSRQCTHLGCTVPWIAAENQFLCPCHSSAFDIRGNAIKPPASRPLDLFRIRIENNIIMVNTADRIKRTAFRDNQVVYAK